MALLDVSDILLDPDFMNTGLVCERNTQTIGLDGIAVNTPALTPFSGVVTSDNGDILQRGDFGERIKGSITIHTRFALIDGTTGFTADIVRWQGRRWHLTQAGCGRLEVSAYPGCPGIVSMPGALL